MGQVDFSGHYQNWTALRTQEDYDFILLRNRLRLNTLFDQGSLRGLVSLDVRNDRTGAGSEFEITLREAYVDLYFDRVDLRIGKQQVVWGKADGLFINDIVCPLDMRWFLLQDFDNIRMGLSMIRADVYLGDWTIEGLWIPDFQPWEFAEPGSDWEFHTSPDVPPIFHIEDPELPEASLENSEFGLKISSFVFGSDVALLLLDGFSDHPVPTWEGTVLTPRYYRSRMYGLNFSRTVGPTLVRGEMGYYTNRRFTDLRPLFVAMPSSLYSVSDFFQGMMGLDFTGPFNTGISVQGIRQQIMNYRFAMIDDEIRHLGTVLVRGSFWRETGTAFLLGIFDPSEKGGLARVLFDYRWVDGLTLSSGTDLLWGNEASIFGQFDANDNLFLKVKYSF